MEIKTTEVLNETAMRMIESWYPLKSAEEQIGLRDLVVAFIEKHGLGLASTISGITTAVWADSIRDGEPVKVEED